MMCTRCGHEVPLEDPTVTAAAQKLIVSYAAHLQAKKQKPHPGPGRPKGSGKKK